MKKVFQIKLKNITRVMAMVIVTSLVTFTGCKNYDDDIKSLETQIAALKTEVNASITTQIGTLTAEINALKTKVTALETNGATDAEVAAVKADILSKTVSLEAFNAYKATVTAELATKLTQAQLDAKIVEVNAAITALGGKVTTLEAKVDAKVLELATADGQIKARLAILEGLLNVANGKSVVLDGFTTQLAAQLALINANKDAIATFQSQLTTLLANDTKTTADVAKINVNLKKMVSQMNLILDIFSSRLTSLEFVQGKDSVMVGSTKVYSYGSYVNGIEAVNLASLTTTCGTVIPTVTVAYHLNPSFITKSDIDFENLQFVVVETKNLISLVKGVNGAAPITIPTIKATYSGIERGKLFVTISVNDLLTYYDYYVTKNDKESATDFNYTEIFKSIALQVPLSSKSIVENNLVFNDADGTVTVGTKVYPTAGVITAQYVRVNDQPINSKAGIARPLASPLNPFYPTTLGTDVDYTNEATSMLGTAKGLKTRFTVDNDGVTAELDPLVIRIPYNANPSNAIDLSQYATIAWLADNTLFDPSKVYGTWVFKFDEPTDVNGAIIPYLRGNVNKTDQQQFISFDATGKMLRTVYTQPEAGAAIGRTPVVRIRAYNSNYPNCPAFTAYTKLYLEEKPRPAAITVDTTFASTIATCSDWSNSTTVQWMNEKLYNKVGISKETFHQMYALSYKISTPAGVVIQKVDNFITDSYTLQWTLTANQIWTSLVGTVTPGQFMVEMVYTPSIPELYPTINIKLSHNFTLPGISNITTTLDKYWYKNDGKTVGTTPVDADFKQVKHNVQVPDVNENTTTRCLFVNNINQAFEQNVLTNPFSLKGLDPYKYEYYFKSPQPALADGTILIPSADGQSLLHSGGDLIAKFYTYSPSAGNILELQKTVKAKELLNKGDAFLKVNVGIRQKFCPEIAVSLFDISVRGNRNFDVVFVRPIKALTNSPSNLVDAKNFGEPGTYIAIREMVQLVDWRHTDVAPVYDSKFNNTDHAYYWGYYGVTRIYVPDASKITTDINGTYTSINNFPNLEVSTAASVLTPGGTITATDGYITYKNNQVIGQVFHLKVPVTIEYVWGTIVTTEIIVTVDKTVGNQVKRK